MRNAHIPFAIAAALFAASCSYETPATAMGACREQWIEKLSPTSLSNVSMKDIQYIQACMAKRGFRIHLDDDCDYISTVSSSRCYKRVMPWDEWM